MPLSPYDVQNIMRMLDSVQQAEAAGKAPPGSSQSYLQDLEGQFEHSMPAERSGQGYTGAIGNPQPTRAPWRGQYDMPGNFERGQHMANSMANDAMLREMGRSTYKLPEDSNVPSGTYSNYMFPGARGQEFAASMGGGPMGAGAGVGMSPAQQRAAAQAAKEWGRTQRGMWGVEPEGRESFLGRNRGRAGARDRMRYMTGR